MPKSLIGLSLAGGAIAGIIAAIVGLSVNQQAGAVLGFVLSVIGIGAVVWLRRDA